VRLAWPLAGGATAAVAVEAGGASAGAAGVSSYSMARTWLIGIVRVPLSSPAICTSLGELETTVPATLVPSRSSMVACCPHTEGSKTFMIANPPSKLRAAPDLAWLRLPQVSNGLDGDFNTPVRYCEQ